MARPRIDTDKYRKIAVLTGAGISAASGMRTYRGPDGLWNDETLVKYSHRETFDADPLGVWRFWWKTREACLAARPNRAHEVLAELEARIRPRGVFGIVTQNIDGLHARAGSRDVVEFHGNVLRARCSNEGCGLPPFRDESVGADELPLCPLCGSPLRPDIVMFGEMIPEANSAGASRIVEGCDLFIAIGTSGTVYPAAAYVRLAARGGARTVYVNLEPIGDGDPFSSFQEEQLGRAELILPELLGMD